MLLDKYIVNKKNRTKDSENIIFFNNKRLVVKLRFCNNIYYC